MNKVIFRKYGAKTFLILSFLCFSSTIFSKNPTSYSNNKELQNELYEKAMYFSNRGVPNIAIRKLFEVLESEEKNTKLYFKTQISIADAYRQIREYDKGFTLLFSVIKNPKIEQEELAFAYTRIAAMFDANKKLKNYRDTVFKYSNLALKISEANGFDFHTATAKNELGNLIKKKGDYKQGILLLEESMQLFKQTKMYLHMSNVAINLSNAYIHFEQFEKAEALIDTSLNYCENNTKHYMLMRLYLHQSKLNKLQENFKKAFYFQEKARRMQLAFYDNSIDTEITEMAAKYDLELKEAKILEEKHKSELRKKKVVVLTITIAVLLILFFGAIIIYRLKQKSILQEKDIIKIKAEILERDYKNKNIELSGAIADIVSYNKILESVKKSIKEKDLNQAISILNSNINTEQNWQNFLLNFNQSFPDFFSKLKAIHPNLTESETKLSALLKMGLKSREIASLLNIAINTVHKNRQRLRKKLNLQAKTDINTYLATIN